MKRMKNELAVKQPADTRVADVASAVDGIRRILQSLRLSASRTQSVVGISAAQLFVLSQLHEREHLSINELARLTLTDRSTVASLVDRLMAKRLVRRIQSPEDRRRAEVSITPSGRALLERAPAAPTQRLLLALEELTDEELHALAQSLERLQIAMKIERDVPHMLFND